MKLCRIRLVELSDIEIEVRSYSSLSHCFVFIFNIFPPRPHLNFTLGAGTTSSKNSGMAAKSIFCISVLAVVLPTGGSSALQGGEGAVCREFSYPLYMGSAFPIQYYPGHYLYGDSQGPWRDHWPPPSPWHPSLIKSEKCCDGYVNVDGTCEPQCKSSCENGYCSKPDKCECNEGYEQTSPNTCLPKCRPPCINGKCVSPGHCECDAGFHPFKEDTSACEPKCSKPCGHGGICTAPETCTCKDGFVRDEARHESCVSTCRTSCNHGICTSKGCYCSYGWGGDSCDETIFCVVTQPANVSFRKPENQLFEPIRVEIVDKNYRYEWRGPMCHKQCLEQLLNTTVVNLTLTNGITTHHFVPVDSLCNAVEDSLELPMIGSGTIGALIGIAISAVVAIIVVVIFIRIRRKPKIVGYTQRLVNDSVEIEPVSF